MVNVPDYVRSSIVKAMHDAKLNAIDEILKVFQSKVGDKLDEFTRSLEIINEYRNDFEKSMNGEKIGKKLKTERKKRSQTAYNKYIGKRMKALKDEMKGVSSKELMKVAMESWKQLPIDEKNKLKEDFLATKRE